MEQEITKILLDADYDLNQSEVEVPREEWIDNFQRVFEEAAALYARRNNFEIEVVSGRYDNPPGWTAAEDPENKRWAASDKMFVLGGRKKNTARNMAGAATTRR